MATVTKPIALNESFVSTELTPRTVADILAEELPRITGRDASQVSYDNTASGLTASDVQDALDEIVGDIPTVNDGTLTIQQNGVTKASFSANTASNVTADIEIPTADEKTATDEFTTANGGLLSECNVTLAPVQDLHGYSNPWVGGAGKNKADINDLSLVQNDSGNKLLQSNLALTAGTYTMSFDVSKAITSTRNRPLYVINGVNTYAPTDYNTQGRGSWTFTLSADSTVTFYWWVMDNSLAVDITNFMIESGSTATDYEPYENICPISGHTEVDLDVKDGDNVTQQTYQVPISSTVYGGTVDVVGGSGEVEKEIAVFNGTENWQGNSGWSNHSFVLNNALPNAISVSGYTTKANIISNLGVVEKPADIVTTNLLAEKKGVGQGDGLSVYVNIGNEYDTVTKFKNYLSNNPLQICYEKATSTPLTTSPTPIETLVGQNNLSTPLDGQSIDSVKYREVFVFDDVEKVVSLRVPISMLGTDESGRTTASRAYTMGEFFYKDGKMYKVLTSIASGATFTVGTNISETTLFAELTALA